MDSLYKRFDCTLSTCKLAGCNAISFPGLEKNADHIKDAGQRMNPICIIKTADPQLFSNLWNELENGNIIGESTNIYPKNIDKSYDVLFKYKTPENSMCIPRNHVNKSFHHRGAGNQNSPHIAGTDDILNRDVMCYICDRPSNYYGKCTLTDHRRTGTQSLQLGYYFTQTNPVHK